MAGRKSTARLATRKVIFYVMHQPFFILHWEISCKGKMRQVTLTEEALKCGWGRRTQDSLCRSLLGLFLTAPDISFRAPGPPSAAHGEISHGSLDCILSGKINSLLTLKMGFPPGMQPVKASSIKHRSELLGKFPRLFLPEL